MLDGWTIASSYGSTTIRSSSISARMSRSESSTRTTYPAHGADRPQNCPGSGRPLLRQSGTPGRHADVAQLVERDLPKVDVASSNLVIRSMSKTDRAEAFTGFPEAALDFYDDLEIDNTRSFWDAHKHVYDEAVRAPMLALTAALAEEFGTAKVFRPYRDVRFAKDKTPYKNHQGAFVAVGPATGWYVEIGSPGVRVGAGYYHAGGPDLARIRAAIDTEHSGQELERIVRRLEKARLRDARRAAEDLAARLRRRPPADRAVALQVAWRSGKSYGFEKSIHTPELLDRVRKDWRALRPLVEWVAAASTSSAERLRLGRPCRTR